MRKLFSIAAAGILCAGAAFAQSASPPPDRHQAWRDAHKGDMAQFHAHMCNDMYAHHVGMVAELGARLDLKDTQRALFDRWKDVVLEGAKSHETACLAHTADRDHRPALPEREAHMREMLKARLAEMDAQAPALDALYASLSPEQKMELDHMHGGFHRGGRGMHGMHHGMGGPHEGRDGPPPPDQQG